MDLAKLGPSRLAGCVFLVVTAVGACTCGDFGLTWDEPVYRQSQQRAAIWFQELAAAGSPARAAALLDPQVLHYHWVYGRFGINFHPPLAGLIDLATYETFGFFLRDIPARRMGAVLCLAGAATLLFRLMAGRHGIWTGFTAVGCLLLTPRVFADGQIGATDIPGLLFWPAAALAFWKGMYQPGAGRARVVCGVCLGLAFLTKPVAMMVVLPLTAWYLASLLRPGIRGGWGRASALDAVVTLGPLLGLLGVALREIRRLATALPPPRLHDLYLPRATSSLPDWYFAIPLLYWLLRRGAARLFRNSAVLGVERPRIETLAAAAALAPFTVWVGNPAWWRATLPRLAHYFALGLDRRDAVPPPPVLYFGESYLYNGPWESAWVLIAITTPLTIMAVELLGILRVGSSQARIDRLPWFFLLNAATLPMLRALSIPGHDGTRLILPSFFFLAAFGAWGALAAARFVADRFARGNDRLGKGIVGAVVLIPALVALVRVHPHEMSYYNPLVGGPRGAWRKGLELTYWWDALTPQALRELDRALPRDAKLLISSGLQHPYDYLETLQRLGSLRGDVRFRAPDIADFPVLLTLTADSKADAVSRILFALTPLWESTPAGLDGARVVALHGERNSAVAFCLQLLTDVTPGEAAAVAKPRPAPDLATRLLPFLARFRGESTSDLPPLGVNESIFRWARTDPTSLRKAAALLAKADPKAAAPDDPDAHRLLDELVRLDVVNWSFSKKTREASPWAIPIAVEILIRRPDELRSVLLRRGFTDPAVIGGPLDRDLPAGP